MKYAIIVAMLMSPLALLAQNGPGGVGSSSNNILWLRAGDLSQSDGTAVSSWTDNSGNGNTFSGPSGLEPTYETNELNGLPVVRFGAVDNSRIVRNPFTGFASTGLSFFIVQKLNENDATHLSYAVSGSTNEYVLDNSDDYRAFINGIREDGSGFSLVDDTWHIVGHQWTNSSGTDNGVFYEDGVLQYSVNASTGSLTDGGVLVFGAEQDAVDGGYQAVQDLDGDVAEIILFSSYLNDGERTIVENYLSAKYGIAVANDYYAYDATHPHDLAGIGQASSGANTTGRSGEILELSSPSALADNDFLLFGHDNGSIASWSTTEIPGSVQNIQRIAREWRIDETNEVGTVSITIDNTLLPSLPANYTDYFILIDADGDFATGASIQQLSPIGGSEYRATGVSLDNGDYISLAVRAPGVNFSTASANGFESVTSVNIEVSLDFAPSLAVDVPFTINGSSGASNPADYSLISTSPITISAGTTFENIQLSIVDDGDEELDESIIVDLGTPTNGVIGTGSQATYVINDDDRSLDIGFTSTTGSGSESSSTLSISLTSSGTDNMADFTVNFEATGGTATGGGVDYFNSSGVATVSSGQTIGSFDININSDVLDEANETIIITLSNPSNNVNLNGNNTFTYTITDDDTSPTISFSQGASNGSEGATPAQIQVSLGAVSGQDVTVDYAATTGTADGSDFTLSNGTLTIPAGSTFGNIEPSIIDDLILEGAESFTITISNPMQSTLGSTTVHTFTINDNETPSVGFSGPGGVGDASTNILWLEPENLTGLTDGQAIGTWTDNSGNSNDVATIVDGADGGSPLYETNELNGQPIVRFGGNSNDNVGRASLTNFPTSAITTVTVLKTTDGTGTTYSYASSAGNNDFFQDQTQNGRFAIANSATTPSGVAFDDGQWNIYIHTWQSSGGSYVIYKNGTNSSSGTFQSGATMTTGGTLTIGAEQDVTGGGFDANQDYDGDIAEVMIYNTVLNDAQRVVVENYLASKFDLTITNDYYSFDASYGTDVSGIGQQGSDTHTSAQSAGIFKVSGASGLDASGDFLLFGHNNAGVDSWGTEEAPDNGTNIQRLDREWRLDLSGDVGSVTATLNISSLPALPAEYTRYYMLIDADGDFSSGAVAYVLTSIGGTDLETNVTFSDGDYVTFAVVRPEIGFSEGTSEIFESEGPASLSLALNFPLDEEVTVDYAINSGSSTATASSDYVLSPGSVTIPAGSTTAAISVTLVDDTTPETDELVVLDLSSPSSNAQLGSIAQHELTIHDTDVTNKIQFAIASSSGSESSTPAQFVISIDNAEVTDVTVDYSVTGGTAAGSGIDFFNSSGTATIEGGMALTQVTIEIDVNEDILDEDDETMIVTLTNPSANVNLGTNTSHTYTINDNDSGPTVGFASTASSGNEGSSPANIEVVLSTISGKDITVDYSSLDITASGSSVDYNLPTGSITILAGASSGFITPAITNDGAVEGAETFTVTIDGATGATPAGNTTHTFTINDNDNLGFSGPGGVGDEDINILWLEAENITGLTDGQALTSWPDNSGNGNDMATIVDGADGGSPLFETNELNGLPVVRFGANDNDNVGRSLLNDFPSTEITTITVLRTTDGSGTVYSYASSAGNNDFFQDQAGTGRFAIANSPETPTGVAFDDGAWNIYIHTWQSAGGTYSIYKNGTNAASGTFQSGTSMTAGGTLTIGAEQDATGGSFDANQDYDGDIAEVIIYNTALNDAQRVILENYLASKYGLSVTTDYYAFDAQFGFDLAGLGQEGSDQHNTAQSAGILEISNPSSLDATGDFLMFGHNNASVAAWTTAEAPNGGSNFQRLPREWKIDQSGTIGDVSVTVDISPLPVAPTNYTQYYLLTDPDGDFSSGATLYPLTNTSGNSYQAGNITFSDGDFVAIGIGLLEVQFNSDASQTFEPNGPASIPVELNFSAATDVSFDYAITGTATGGGVDYTLVDGSFTITSGNSSGNISIPLTNDTELEDDETVILTISNPTGAQLGSNTVHTFSINDDDNTRRISFNKSDSTNTEANSPISLTIELSSSIGGDPTDPVNPTRVDYAVTGGTATGGGPDYTLADGTATINAGTTSTTIDLVINQDALDEADETIEITLSNPENSNLADNNTILTYTIQDDDDEPTISFLNSVNSGTEGSSPANVEVQLSSQAGRDVTVDFTVSDGSASGNNVDYNLLAGTLTIAAGSSSGFIQAVIIDDVLAEGSEDFTITLTDNMSSPSGATIGTHQSTTFTITDNDSDGSTGPGGVGDEDINILWLEAENISGLTDGQDLVIWPDNSGNNNDLATIVDVADGSAPVYRTNVINGREVVRFGSNDNDNVGRSVMNDFPSTEITTITVLNTTDGTGTTYSYASAAGNNDFFQDQPQNGRFSVANSNTTPAGVAFDDGNWNIYIHTWQSSGGNYNIYKNGTNASSGVFQDGASMTAGGTLVIGSEQDATGGSFDANQDYDGDIAEAIIYNTVLNDAQRVIVENYLSTKYGISIAADLYDQDANYPNDVAGIGRASAGNEHLAAQSAGIIALSNASDLDMDGEYLLFGHDAADVTTWTFTESPNTNTQRLAREWYVDQTGGDGVGAVTVQINATLFPSLPLGYENYTLLIDDDGDFSAGVTSQDLGNVSGSLYEASNVTISDGSYLAVGIERRTIQFSLASSQTREPEGPGSVQVELSSVSSSDVTVDYTITGGTATNGGTDYLLNPSSGTLTISAGNTTTSLFIPLVDDATIENSETIIIALTGPSSGITLGTNSTHTFNISDDDNSREIDFQAITGSGGEGTTPVAVTVQINEENLAGGTSVDYTVSGGSASGSGVDFTLADGSVTVPQGAGNLTATFDIDIVDDAIFEGNETIEITLVSAASANLGTNQVFTFTITDDESTPTIDFSSSSVTVNESGGTADVEVQLSAESSSDVTVSYASSNGGAVAPGDFTASSGMITIPAGSTTADINITIIDDSDLETNEDFTLALSTPSGASLGTTNNPITVTIVDDDNIGIVGPGGVGSNSNNLLWLKADDIGQADMTGVTSWTDASGNANNFTDGTGTPTYRTSIQNGLPVVRFDGNDAMTGSSTVTGTSGRTVFIAGSVASGLSTSTFAELNTGRSGGTGTSYRIRGDVSIDVNSGDRVFSTGFTLSSFNVLTISNGSNANANSISGYLGGTNLTQTSATAAAINTQTGGMTIGGTSASGGELDGDIGEIIVYDTELNDAQRILVENYLAERWGTVTTPDVYDGQGTYEFEVAGLGQVDGANFHLSFETAGIITVNAPAGIGNGEYLLAGHDNGGVSTWQTSDVPNSGVQRLDREWYFDETGDISSADISVDITGFPVPNSGYTVYVLLSDVDGDFSSGATIYPLTDQGSNIYQLQGLPISDGYLALGVAQNLYNGGAFDQASSWLAGFVPGSGQSAIVSAGMAASLNADITIGSISLADATASLDLNGQTLTLDMGCITLNGGSLNTATAGSTVVYASASDQCVTGTTYNVLNLTGGATKTLQGAVDVDGDLTISSAVTLDVNGTNTINLAGDWTNNGIFSEGTGTVVLDGSGAQNITSLGSESFHNLTIAKTSGSTATIQQSTTVTNQLTLTSGLVSVGTEQLIIGESAVISGGDAGSYVLAEGTGTLNKLYPDGSGSAGSFNFAIGDSEGYTPLTFTLSAGTRTSAEVSSNISDTSHPGIDSAQHLSQYWTIEANGISGPTFGISFTYSSVDVVVSDTAFVPLKFNSAADTSDFPSYSLDHANNIISWSGLTSFSAVTAQGSNDTSLPVELVNFTAKESDGSALLRWQTAIEVNNDRFIIEKSTDARFFYPIGSVTGAGSSEELQHYQFLDNELVPGMSYYRLKQIDFDGSFEYSPVIFVEYEIYGEIFAASLFPNPAQAAAINLSLATSNLNQQIRVDITDMTGRLLEAQVFSPVAVKSIYELSPTGLSGGTYLVRISQPGHQTITRRLVISN